MTQARQQRSIHAPRERVLETASCPRNLPFLGDRGKMLAWRWKGGKSPEGVMWLPLPFPRSPSLTEVEMGELGDGNRIPWGEEKRIPPG